VAVAVVVAVVEAVEGEAEVGLEHQDQVLELQSCSPLEMESYMETPHAYSKETKPRRGHSSESGTDTGV